MLNKNNKIIIASVIFLVLFSVMQFTVPHIIGYDGYFNIKSAENLIQVEFNLTIFFDSTYYKTTFEDFYIYYGTNPGQSQRTALQTENEWTIVKKYVENVQNSIYKNIVIR